MSTAGGSRAKRSGGETHRKRKYLDSPYASQAAENEYEAQRDRYIARGKKAKAPKDIEGNLEKGTYVHRGAG